MEDVQKKIKGFFERPEGNMGLVVIFGAILAFLFAGNYILPFVITALANALYAAALGGVLLTIIALAMSPRVRTFVSLAFVMTMRWLTAWIIEIDPIGILKNYLSEMDDKLEDIAKNLGKLNGQKKKLERIIADEEETIEKAMRMSQQAYRQNMKAEAASNANRAARSKDLIERLSTIKKSMEKLLEILKKMQSAVKLMREDTADTIRIKELEFKATKAAHGAMKSAQALLSGGTARDLYDEASEFLVEDIAAKMGEVEMFFDLSEDFLTNTDLQNAVWDEQGLEMLDKWEREGTLLSYEGRKVRVDDSSFTEDVHNGVPVEAPQETTAPSSSFANFFKD